MVFIHDRCGMTLIDALIVELGFLSGSIDPAEIPAGFNACEDDACSCVSMLEEIDGCPDEKAVKEGGGDGRLGLA